MLTYEQWREDIVEHQFPKFKKWMREQSISTSCKVDLAVKKTGGQVGRVTVEAWETGDRTDICVLTFLYGKGGQAEIVMARFRQQADGRPRRTKLLKPLSGTKAFTLFGGEMLARFAAKAEQLKKKRRPPIARKRPGGTSS
jgi:hypothetical protein